MPNFSIGFFSGKNKKLPSDLKKNHDRRTRQDAFETVWSTCETMLACQPELEAKTLLEWLVEQNKHKNPPPFHEGQLRTLQRRIRDWRALKGREQEVIFPQVIKPGKQSQSDCTCMNDLNIVIAGQDFRHLLFHFMLLYSRWEQAKLPRNKRLSDFEIAGVPGLSPSLIHRLAEGEFIDRCENILLFGNPGSGKTHLSIALAHEWCLRGRRVFYTTAVTLMQELLRAKQIAQLDFFIKKLDRFEVLVIDGMGYVACEKQEADVLFMLLAARYEQRSLVISCNLVFSQWQQIFKDEMTTADTLDRLVHHSIVLELNASSFRMDAAKKQKNNQKAESQLEIEAIK